MSFLIVDLEDFETAYNFEASGTASIVASTIPEKRNRKRKIPFTGVSPPIQKKVRYYQVTQKFSETQNI